MLELATSSAEDRSANTTGSLSETRPDDIGPESANRQGCFHCGNVCPDAAPMAGDKQFCCQGCLVVYELLVENGLDEFYRLAERPGIRANGIEREERFRFLDDPAVRKRIVDFSNERLSRVTFRIPAIHCVACVWLLENLFRLRPGVGESRVNFPRKEVSIAFETGKLKLSELVALLASLGYEPDLNLSDLDERKSSRIDRRLWLQLGIAGFAFGNVMLFSISSYLGLDSISGPRFKALFGYLSLVLSIPVLIYSAADYWRSALVGLRQKLLTIEVPIAAGLIAIFAHSTYEVVSGHGEGYFDTLTGLIFFLLCGRLFQQKTFERLTFDRDYKAFFPLSVTRVRPQQAIAKDHSTAEIPRDELAGEEPVALAQLRVGDHLIIRSGELIPADSELVRGNAIIDYSFVTGESDPVEKACGEYLYAGGRQIGGALEVTMVKPVSQSYLTSLWDQEAFRKRRDEALDTLTNRYSRRFTKIVIGIALGAAAFWWWVDPSRSVKAFTSVLIVACPCALALAAPFTLGTAVRVLGRRRMFLKGPQVIESLAQVNSVVFDKTGTLTVAGPAAISFQGQPLSDDEMRLVCSVAKQSTHPYAARIGSLIAVKRDGGGLSGFVEMPGAGIEAMASGKTILLGSTAWLQSHQIPVPANSAEKAPGGTVHVAIDGIYRGCFVLTGTLRAETDRLIRELRSQYELAVISGDNTRDHERISGLFGNSSEILFNQSPLNKLEFIRGKQQGGRKVMMVGDGLNDSGALRQSDVGVAVVENVSAFSPASDVILDASMASSLGGMLRFARESVRIVRLSFLISSLYNVIGIAIAAAGLLSPVVCAILMPVSSVSVVGFASAMTTWRGARLGRSVNVGRIEEANNPVRVNAYNV